MQEKAHVIHGITTFPMVLREHLDSDIRIESKIVSMNNDNKTKTDKAFEDGKKKSNRP